VNILNQVQSSIIDFAARSEVTYHVNPWIFCIIFFGSAAPLYYGYYRISKSILVLEDKKIKRKSFDVRELKIGVTISVISWWLPYLYVIIFGKLPFYMWMVFILFVAIMGILFVSTLVSKIRTVIKP
jgi:hypothetical protein